MGLLEVVPLVLVLFVMHRGVCLGPALVLDPELIANRLVLLEARPLKLLVLEVLPLRMRLETVLQLTEVLRLALCLPKMN